MIKKFITGILVVLFVFLFVGCSNANVSGISGKYVSTDGNLETWLFFDNKIYTVPALHLNKSYSELVALVKEDNGSTIKDNVMEYKINGNKIILIIEGHELEGDFSKTDNTINIDGMIFEKK